MYGNVLGFLLFFLDNDVIKMEGCLWFLMLNVDLKEIFFIEFIFVLKLVK